MKKVWGYFCIVTMTAYVTTAWGYEIGTHEKLSTAAAEASQLKKDPELLKNLGVTLTDKFKNTDGADRNIPELIGDGARFEDDTNGVKRPLNHFYNPLNNQPLTSGGLSYNTSPDWALEDNGDLYFQHNSYKDARAYFFAALTGSALTDRQKSFGLTFQTLGMVIHHIQDMAQPQHVRNDAHCDVGIFGCGIFFYNPSLYEKYSDDQRKKGALPFAGYNPVYSSTDTTTFNSPRNLWHTAGGKGMADFTNRGFVSAGTIFDIAFPSPVLDLSKKLDFDIKHLVPGTSLKGNVRFYGNTVTDNYTGASVDNPMAVTRSIFDAELEKYATFGKKAVYTLNSFNFDVAHSFLIPRAVGYSAGLINYFFRGKIDFIEDTNNAGKYVIKNLGPEDMKGTFTLYYDAVDGKRYPVAGDTPSATWAARTISSKGQMDNLSLTPPTNPAPSIPDEYVLVFNGDMGEEKAIPGVTVGAVAAKVVANPGVLLATTPSETVGNVYPMFRSFDYGKTWQPFGTAPYYWLNYLGQGALLSGDYVSSDRGQTWGRLPFTPKPDYRQLGTAMGNDRMFAADTTVISSPGALLDRQVFTVFSNDGGRSWQNGSVIPGMSRVISPAIYLGDNRLIMRATSLVPAPGCDASFLFKYGFQCLLINGSYWHEVPALFLSADGGGSWGKIRGDGDRSYLHVYAGKTKMVNGKVVADRNGGRTVISPIVAGSWGVYTYSFIRSLDGGISWTEVGYPQELNQLSNPYHPEYLVYAGHGRLVMGVQGSYDFNSDSNLIYQSTDYGDSWNLVGAAPGPSSNYSGLFELKFVSDAYTDADFQ